MSLKIYYLNSSSESPQRPSVSIATSITTETDFFNTLALTDKCSLTTVTDNIRPMQLTVTSTITNKETLSAAPVTITETFISASVSQSISQSAGAQVKTLNSTLDIEELGIFGISPLIFAIVCLGSGILIASIICLTCCRSKSKLARMQDDHFTFTNAAMTSTSVTNAAHTAATLV